MTMRRAVGALSVMALSAACGPTLRTSATAAMDGCLAVRNPAFVRGDGERALSIPLPPAVDSLAKRTAYAFGLRMYKATAAEAGTQAELTCAMELASWYRSEDTREWLVTFTNHPNAPVASLAKRLLALNAQSASR